MLTESKSFNEQFRWRLNSLLPRYILLLLACISTICFAITLVLSNSNIWPEDLSFGCWGLAMSLASVLSSFCWTIFCLLRRRFSTSPLHPGWLLSLDLICFLAIAACCSLGTPTSLFWVGESDCLVPTDDLSNGPVSKSCEVLIHLVADLEVTGFAAAFLMAIVHFVFFVMACRATDLHNREKKRRSRAGKQMELPSYSFNGSQKTVVGIGSLHELDTCKSLSSTKGCYAWASEMGSSQDHDCAAELGGGRKHGLADECNSSRKSLL